MRVRAHDQVGAGIDGGMGEIDLGLVRLVGVLVAGVHGDDDEVGAGVQLRGRGAGGAVLDARDEGIASGAEVVERSVRSADEGDADAVGGYDSRLPGLVQIRAGADVLDGVFIEQPGGAAESAGP